MSDPFSLGSRRKIRNTTWTLITNAPHPNGDPAYVIAESSTRRRRTFHWAAWLVMTPVEETPQ